MLLQRRTILFALLALLATPAAYSKDSPVLRIDGSASSAVQQNVRVLVNIQRYPCQPPVGQYGLLRRQIRNNAEQGLQALGYYNGRIDLQLEQPDGKACLQARLSLQPGPATLLDKVDIQIHGEAADDALFASRIRNTELKQGAQLRHDHYSSMKRDLQQLLLNRGYLQGQLSHHRLLVDRQNNTATVELYVDSGPRYRFGEVQVQGSVLKDSLLYDYLQFAPGQPFDNSQLLNTQQTYLGVGYFSAVRMERGEPDPQTLAIPITVNLNDRRRWALLTGVGVSTDTGPRLRFGVENRRVNRSGHRFRAETEVSAIRQGAGATYQIPLGNPLKERLDLHARYVKDDTESAETERLSTGVDYIVELNNKWVTTTSIEYLRELYTVAGVRDKAELIMPGFQLSRTKASDPIYPRRGWRLSSRFRFAQDQLGSSTSFQQLTLNGKLILPVPVLKGRLLSRLDMGFTEVDQVTSLPASIRFFAGGDSSIRGFAFESIGPEDSDGEVIGGRHLLTGSIEYDQPIAKKWSLAVFQDYGNAFNALNALEFRRSAGAGIRWRSPLGPIRVDFARPLDDSGSWRLHLSMGPDL